MTKIMHIYNTKLTTCKRNTYNLCDMYNDCEKQLRTKQEKESAINLETYQLLAISYYVCLRADPQ